MRALQVCQPADGGVAAQVLTLCVELRARGWTVDVACSRGALAEDLKSRGFDVWVLPLVREVSPREDLAAALGLLSVIRKGNYSLVHTHSAKGGAVGRLAAWLARIPSLYTPHAWPFLISRTASERRFYVAVEQVLASLSKRIICVSTGEFELGRRYLRGGRKKLRLVPNGIMVPPRIPVRPRDPGVTVGTLVRLTRQKGIRYLIQAAAAVRARNPAVRFSVAGDGPDLRSLRKEVADRKLETTFEFVGPVPDPWRYLEGIEVFVLPSLWEGMPFALLEAMGSGLPVVATDVGGIRDAIPNEAFGTVVPPADPRALGGAILRYAGSPRLREAVGRAARERVLREFSRERMIERTLDVYSEVVGGRVAASDRLGSYPRNSPVEPGPREARADADPAA